MTTVSKRCAVVGPGRIGTAIAASLRDASWQVDGPYGRGERPTADVVLLCVPDSEIAAAAAAIEPRSGLFVGHVSGATSLAPLTPHRAFSVHPLMTVSGPDADFAGAPGAVAGENPEALEIARAIATALGLNSFEIADDRRAAYHAGASVASNYLLAVLDAAEQISGLDADQLAPLVRATVDGWRAKGAGAALTGPVARGDEATVARQRDAVELTAPHLTGAFDALTGLTRELAQSRDKVAA